MVAFPHQSRTGRDAMKSAKPKPMARGTAPAVKLSAGAKQFQRVGPDDMAFEWGSEIVFYRPGRARGSESVEAAVHVAQGKLAVMLARSEGRQNLFWAVGGTPGAAPIREDRADPEAFPRLAGIVVVRVPIPERGAAA